MNIHWRKYAVVLLIPLLCVILAGCASVQVTPRSSSGSSERTASSVGSRSSDAVTRSTGGASGNYKIPEFRDAVFDASAAQGNSEAQIDMSSVSKGYVALFCETDARVKFQVVKGDVTYTYNVEQGRPQIYPLQSGNGTYTFKVMKNLEDNKYFELYSCSADVKIEDAFDPYLRPNQYADYGKDSKCVKKAGEFAKAASDETDYIAMVFEYICKTVTYDYDFAETVPPGYIPDPDETMRTGKGICIDYACLAACMLRSQGIPTKIIFGYVAPDDIYHAWNMYYTEEEGWITVEFKTSRKDWNRMDATFSANGADSKFIGDSSSYLDVYQY